MKNLLNLLVGLQSFGVNSFSEGFSFKQVLNEWVLDTTSPSHIETSLNHLYEVLTNAQIEDLNEMQQVVLSNVLSFQDFAQSVEPLNEILNAVKTAITPLNDAEAQAFATLITKADFDQMDRQEISQRIEFVQTIAQLDQIATQINSLNGTQTNA